MILSNLLSNAVHFSPAGGAIAVRWGAEAAGWWLRVADQGPGMGPEDAARAFERFHRAGDGSSGTGLGLPIVAAIAAAHGGGAQLFSEPGQGTVVRVSLRDLS